MGEKGPNFKHCYNRERHKKRLYGLIAFGKIGIIIIIGGGGLVDVEEDSSSKCAERFFQRRYGG